MCAQAHTHAMQCVKKTCMLLTTQAISNICYQTLPTIFEMTKALMEKMFLYIINVLKEIKKIKE